METLKFKTNIKCSACVAKVTPHLDKVEGVESWEVDLNDPNRILTVALESGKETKVREAVEDAGYTVEGV